MATRGRRAGRRVSDGASLETFTEVMAGHAASVAVLTVVGHGTPRGLAVTSLSSYSASPPSVVAAVGVASRTHDHLVASSEFGVNLLAHHQADVAAVFAGRSEEKFAQVDWSLEQGVPRLANVRAFMRCRRAATLAHGDHTVLVGEVIDLGGEGGNAPLVHFKRASAWDLSRAVSA